MVKIILKNDMDQKVADLKQFKFRNLHPRVILGTASDRYAGWLGQIYTPEKYEGRIARRMKNPPPHVLVGYFLRNRRFFPTIVCELKQLLMQLHVAPDGCRWADPPS